MSRFIDADAMTEILEHDIELDARALDNMDFVGAEREQTQLDKDCKQNCVRYLAEQPTIDAVEVVRCKECKHYNAGFECLIEGYGIERDPDWYCADGERRTE